jgi:nucleoside-diphosphate-sugar epimerase
MKNILIIGGSYFAGRVFVEELLREKRYNIYIFNRGRIPLKFEGITELVGDRNDTKSIREVIPDRKWDALVDFCAYTPSDIEKMLESLPGSLDHYIFISTTTVYDNSFDLPIMEDATKLSGPQPELGEYASYGYDKWLTECRLKELCAKKGVAYTCLRPSIIYGRYNYAPRESYFFDLIRDGKPIFLPDNELALFSFIWVVDMAKLIIKCLENKNVFKQAFNLAAEELVSYRKILKVLEELCGKKLNVMELSIHEINSERIPLPFPPDRHLVYSGAKAQRILEFQYTPFEHGMRETYAHYQWVQKRMASK